MSEETTPAASTGCRDVPATDALADAHALYSSGQLDRSEQAFTALLDTRFRPGALYGLAMIAWKRGDPARSRALLEQSLGVDRRNPELLCDLARMRLADGDRDGAIALLGEALSYQPSHRAALGELVALGEAGPAASPAQTPVATIPRPPHQPNSSDSLVGTVNHVVRSVGPYRGSPAALQILTFRVQTYDGAGSPGEVVGVTMRGTEITGTLEEGDWVEIEDRPRSGEGAQPKEVRNLTVNDVVKAKMAWIMTR
jgi:tetratricopeptide (TPR) repeat protein